MKEKLIEFYREWIQSELTKKEFADKHDLKVYELNSIIHIGMTMHQSSIQKP